MVVEGFFFFVLDPGGRVEFLPQISFKNYFVIQVKHSLMLFKVYILSIDYIELIVKNIYTFT